MNLEQIKKELLLRDPLPPLFPKRVWREELRRGISELEAAMLAKAVLHLLNDDLGLCHEIAQANENPDGNYLHAILHRRERDFGNSKYWLDRVGGHSVWKKMSDEYKGWTPTGFVDDCESNRDEAELERRQAIEMRWLLESLL